MEHSPCLATGEGIVGGLVLVHGHVVPPPHVLPDTLQVKQQLRLTHAAPSTINQSINQFINQSINLSINKFINSLMNQLPVQSINKSYTETCGPLHS